MNVQSPQQLNWVPPMPNERPPILDFLKPMPYEESPRYGLPPNGRPGGGPQQLLSMMVLLMSLMSSLSQLNQGWGGFGGGHHYGNPQPYPQQQYPPQVGIR